MLIYRVRTPCPSVPCPCYFFSLTLVDTGRKWKAPCRVVALSDLGQPRPALALTLRIHTCAHRGGARRGCLRAARRGMWWCAISSPAAGRAGLGNGATSSGEGCSPLRSASPPSRPAPPPPRPHCPQDRLARGRGRPRPETGGRGGSSRGRGRATGPRRGLGPPTAMQFSYLPSPAFGCLWPPYCRFEPRTQALSTFMYIWCLVGPPLMAAISAAPITPAGK